MKELRLTLDSPHFLRMILICSALLTVVMFMLTGHSGSHDVFHHGSTFPGKMFLFITMAFFFYYLVKIRHKIGREKPSPKPLALPNRLEIRAMVKKLQYHLDNSHPYLDENLNLPDLARQLNATPQFLSKVINRGMGMSYTDLITQRRVSWAKKLLADQAKKNEKLLAIAWDSGFRSKSTFYQAFKKYTGHLPSAFRP